MKHRVFNQYCGVARALELAGERWALLIVRDLLIHARRYTDLHDGLPGIPTNVLSTRLKELENAGLVERQIAPAPQRGVVYALTAEGRSLEPIVVALGRWGAKRLGEPRPGEVVTPDAFAFSLRSAFRETEAAGLNASWEIRAPDMVVHAVVSDGKAEVGIGPAPNEADLVITFTPDDLPSYESLMRTISDGHVEFAGRPELLETFTRVFTRSQPQPVH